VDAFQRAGGPPSSLAARHSAHVAEPVGGFTGASIDGLIAAASAEPAGFRLLFQHAAREPEFRAQADQFRGNITNIAYLQIKDMVQDHAWAQWAVQLAPVVAIEAITAWLDAGQPDPDRAAAQPGRQRRRSGRSP
jgi:hypothetical protein